MHNNWLHWTFCSAGAAQNPSESERYVYKEIAW